MVNHGTPREGAKVIGVGLNKTGTKTLRRYLLDWGFRHRTYDLQAFECFRRGDISEILTLMDNFDSFEDWPWPLIFREIDTAFPDARFILTRRSTPDVWFRSLCNMAVRRGPLTDFEEYIYGHAMPQGHMDKHIDYYLSHNAAVREHFRNRPNKLLEICWEEGDGPDNVARFLGLDVDIPRAVHVNRSPSVYSGDNRFVAEIARIGFKIWYPMSRLPRAGRRKLRGLVRRLIGTDEPG